MSSGVAHDHVLHLLLTKNEAIYGSTIAPQYALITATIFGDPNDVTHTAVPRSSQSVEAGAFRLSMMWIDTIGRKRDDE